MSAQGSQFHKYTALIREKRNYFSSSPEFMHFYATFSPFSYSDDVFPLSHCSCLLDQHNCTVLYLVMPLPWIHGKGQHTVMQPKGQTIGNSILDSKVIIWQINGLD